MTKTNVEFDGCNSKIDMDVPIIPVSIECTIGVTVDGYKKHCHVALVKNELRVDTYVDAVLLEPDNDYGGIELFKNQGALAIVNFMSGRLAVGDDMDALASLFIDGAAGIPCLEKLDYIDNVKVYDRVISVDEIICLSVCAELNHHVMTLFRGA